MPCHRLAKAAARKNKWNQLLKEGFRIESTAYVERYSHPVVVRSVGWVCVAVPLTPALSLGERETGSAVVVAIRARPIGRATDKWFSLSYGRGRGEGKGNV